MLSFPRKLPKVCGKFKKPDAIVATSSTPMACMAGLKLAKKCGCKGIAEIADLWPESFVAYDFIGKKNLLLQPMYAYEKRMYTKADTIIFTMEGGKDYIIEKGWDKAHGGPVDIGKIYYINNGVDLEVFDYNRKHYTLADPDLDDPDTFKVVYTGSIRLANRVDDIVDAALELKKRNVKNVKIFLYGSGNYADTIIRKIQELKLDNIQLKGFVHKKYIPYILSKSDLNIYLLKDTQLYRFGLSLNKCFEYFASGKPVLASAKSGYSLIDRYACGETLESYNPKMFIKKVLYFRNLPAKQYEEYCLNAQRAANDFDYTTFIYM